MERSPRVMRERKIDYLVMRNDEEFLGGYVRWFSDFAARHSYPFTVIFPADDEMTLISCGAPPRAIHFLPNGRCVGSNKGWGPLISPRSIIPAPWMPNWSSGSLKEKKRPTIGLVGRSFMPVTFYEYLRRHMPGSKFVDVTDDIDRVKVIKSPEEIELIKGTAQRQDAAMEQVRKSIRPGRRDFEILAEAQYSMVMQGSERQLILVGSTPKGVAGRWQFRHFQNRMIKEGDQVNVLIETNGPGGFYTEIGRIFSLGTPSQALQDAMDTAIEAQALSLSLLKPGASPKDLWDANNEFLQKRGYQPERRLYAHGQGYDLVERPAIRYDEPMKIEAGMNLTIHPFAINADAWAVVTDNYLVTETGASECLHKTQKQVIVIQ